MAHSNFGMSGQHIIMACAASASAQDGMPNPSNKASEIGTAVHEAIEKALLYGFDVADFVGQRFNGIKITNKMADAGQEFVDYIYEVRKLYPDAVLYSELRVCISSIDPELLWGTGDIVMYSPSHRVLIIGDYKNGYETVDVEKEQFIHALNEVVKGNPQVVGYGLGALDTLNLWDKVDHVINFIGQPNKDHVNGTMRHVTYSINEMRGWWGIYKASHELATSDNPPFNPGKHCKYCRFRGLCGPRLRDILVKIQLDENIITADPNQVLAIYNEISAIKTALEAVEMQTLRIARNGTQVPGKKLVREIKRAVCTDEDSFISEALDSGIDENDLYNRKLKSKTDLRAVLDDDLVHKYFKVPERGLTLVDISDPRPATMADAKPDATGIFTNVEGK